MKVGIDATSWSNRRGYGRFTRGLVGSLLETPAGHDFRLFVDAQCDPEELPEGAERVVMQTLRAPSEAASAGGNRSLRDLWTMRQAVGRHQLDVFFFPTVYTWFPLRKQDMRVIVGIHDVIAEDYPSLVFPLRHRRSLWRVKSWLARRQADHLMTVSEYSRHGLVERFRWPADRISVVGEAPDPVFRRLGERELDREVLGRYGLAPERPFLIYLGGVNPHKNLPSLLRVLARLGERSELLDLLLVIVGALHSDGFTPGVDALQRTVEQLGLEGRVVSTGFLPDEEVVHLLNAARVLVLPSAAEGFGLPAVEAAACGTPVVATRNSPLPRILEGAGLFVDPLDETALQVALESVLLDPDLWQRLSDRALSSAQALSWQSSVGQFLAMLERVRE